MYYLVLHNTGPLTFLNYFCFWFKSLCQVPVSPLIAFDCSGLVPIAPYPFLKKAQQWLSWGLTKLKWLFFTRLCGAVRICHGKRIAAHSHCERLCSYVTGKGILRGSSQQLCLKSNFGSLLKLRRQLCYTVNSITFDRNVKSISSNRNYCLPRCIFNSKTDIVSCLVNTLAVYF